VDQLVAGEGIHHEQREVHAAGTVAREDRVAIDAVGVGRLPAPVELALYFCCMEAVQNAAKHSGAGSVSVRLGANRDRWVLTVEDDGAGFDQARTGAVGTGAGLANIRDRLDALGGTLTVGSMSGLGTTVTALVPRNEDLEPAHPPHRFSRQVS
jgi:signal transduction histidine kinase